MRGWIAVRVGSLPISFRFDRRVPAVLLGLSLLTLAILVVNVGVGEYPIAPFDVVKTVLGKGNSDYDFIVNTLRLPRALAASLVGMGMALSGAILQGLTRNDLASPGVIGLNAGANLAAVIVLVLLPSLPIFWLPFAAFGGALIATVLAYLLAWKRGSSSMRLVLVGIGIASLAHAISTGIITFGPIYVVSQAMVWMSGSVYGRSWEHVHPLLAWMALFIPLTFGLARHLNALHLGDDIARGLGSRVEWQRGALLLCSVALAGASVAVAGPIGFVGLMAPHIARRLSGASHEGLLPTAALVGAALVVGADLMGRVIFAPYEIPCGLITSALGAPYFIYLLYRTRKA